MKLTDQQIDNILKVWTAYLDGGEKYVYPGTGFTHKELDQHRLEIIPQVKNMVDNFINGSVTVDEFKEEVEEINKTNLLWGFSGANGAAYFDLIASTVVKAKRHTEFNHLLKETLPAPINPDFAVNNIRTFINFVRSVADFNPDLRSTPRVGSILYFLSYFWQTQKPDIWPIYYTSVVNEMKEQGIWSPTGDIIKDYAEYQELNHFIIEIIESKTDKEVKLWEIEHAFWHAAVLKEAQRALEQAAAAQAAAEPATQRILPKKRTPAIPKVEIFKTETESASAQAVPEKKPIPVATEKAPDEPTTERKSPQAAPEKQLAQEAPKISLSDSYIPPVVSLLPALAIHNAHVAELCRQSGQTIDEVFEDRLATLFGMLGYETKQIGQGLSREPDGVAVSKDHQYAIIYEGKIRPQGYTVGVDERAQPEEIIKLGDRLRKQGYRMIYYMIVSGKFGGDYDDASRTIKIETGVNEVLLVEAGALLAMLESKLRDPELTLGPKHIQKLLAGSGLLDAETVNDYFGE